MKRVCLVMALLFLFLTTGGVCFAETSCVFYWDNFSGAELVIDGEKREAVPGDWRDEITSFRLMTCYEMTVYEDHDFEDTERTVMAGSYDYDDLKSWDLHDQIDSYDIKRFMELKSVSGGKLKPDDKFTITGDGFQYNKSPVTAVTIGGERVKFKVLSDTEIEVTMGYNQGEIKVLSAHCELTGRSLEPVICPEITSISAGDEILPGESFYVNGRDFNDVTAVKIGNDTVEYSVVSSTRIEAVVGQKGGKVTVVTDDCEAVSTQDVNVPAVGFTYYDISGDEIESEDQNLIEKNAVKRVDKRQHKTEYVLEIGHDFSNSGLSSGYLENFGNSIPGDGKHWIKSGETADIRIDGIVYEATRNSRHLAAGYLLSVESGGAFKEDEQRFEGDPKNEQSFTLTIDGPKKVFFLWHTQYAFQVMTMPAAMGENVDPGPGTHWRDMGESVTTSARDGCLKVEGYRDNIAALIETVAANSKTYVMDQPVQITWQYEAHNYEETVFVGNAISFLGVPAEVLARANLTAEPVKPVSTDVSQTQQSAEELYYWSPSDKKLFPLIGDRTFQVEWNNKEGGKCEQKLITTVHAKWPEPVHYVHVAETPPVLLDPQGDDEFAFKGLKYTSNEAQVSAAMGFSAIKAGKTTLLFTKVAGGDAATGDANTEPAYVRVVETRPWTQDKKDDAAEIGKEIQSGLHDSQINHNGYVFWNKARYNADIHNRDTLKGPIFPVNRQFTASPEDDLLVVWYQLKDNIAWPYQPVLYNCQWPASPKRIVIASRQGGECDDANGAPQTWPDRNGDQKNYLDPGRYKDVAIYQQNDPELPGYNPNEEHAVAAASFRHNDMAAPPIAPFALRDDLNIETQDETHTSENYVLIQYYDLVASRHAMEAFSIEREDPANGYKFEYAMKAGDLLTAPYPLNQVIGAAPPTEISGRNGDSTRNCYWEDHKGQSWAVSGNAHLFAYFWYPLAPEFWYEKDHNGDDANEKPGDPIPWLPDGVVSTSDDSFSSDMLGLPKAVEVRYDTKWPDETPVLKAGETLTFAGGEYRADNPQTPAGLPLVLGWDAGQVIFDDLNPTMDKNAMFDDYLVRLAQVLEERVIPLPTEDMPEALQPAAGKVKVEGGRWYFKELHSGLKTRLFYDPLMSWKNPETGETTIGALGVRGFVNGKTLGDSDLTASPPSVYVLQSNILTEAEKDAIYSLEGANDAIKYAATALYNLTRDPSELSDVDGDYTVGISDAVEELADFKKTLFEAQFASLCGSLHSLCPSCGFDDICSGDALEGDHPYPNMALGTGLALMPSAALLDPDSTVESGYATLAENNHPALGDLPVVLHVIKVVNDKYRGAIKTIESDNVFDEKITLRHTADFGANPQDVVFEWYYREEDGSDQPPPDSAPAGTWSVFPGNGPEVAMTGAGSALLRDNLFFCRYRHKDADEKDPDSWSNWAGAANSRPPEDDEQPVETYQAQLAEGWVKRVINGINPFEARINDFYSSDSPATYSSMVQQAGQRFEGAVAFNPAKDVIENIGLIELYQTVFNRAKDLSIDLEQAEGSSGVYAALLLAASRVAGFYTLLGNEAYNDALDPTIGFGTDSVEYGSLAPTIFTFMNQVPTLLDEELTLLRGRAEEGARPVYNRLLWNFTKAEGEAAYALSYAIDDKNRDGFIDEADGRAMFPQGHGDAWGHYLTALKGYYDLLGHDQFNWESRSEKFQIEGVVLDVDYLDERKFAETAAAKAKVGAEVVDLTYRSKYVEDPDGQWQGYRDADPDRAWGLEEWAGRAGTAAYYDWVTANAILPSSTAFIITEEDIDRLEAEEVPQEDINPLYALQDKGFQTQDEFMDAVREALGDDKAAEHGALILEIADNGGLKRIDRTTVPELLEIASQARQIQQKYDEANTGLTPLGVAADAVPFDIDPSRMRPGFTAVTHFEQTYERAMKAMENAQVVFDHANDLKNRIRQVANDTETFTEQVIDQDRDYRNRLIEIFGTPYEGTIGSGKVYPAGYKGPDYFLYMYIDVNEVSAETVPQPSGAIKGYFDPLVVTGYEDDGKELFSQFFNADMPGGIAEGWASTDFNAASLEIEFPISAGKYSFQAPDDWGGRKSPGEVQQALIELVKAEADLQLALADYAGLMLDIQNATEVLQSRSDLRDGQISVYNKKMASTVGFNTMIAALDHLITYADAAKETTEKVTEATVESVSLVSGLSNDALSAVRGGLRMKDVTTTSSVWQATSVAAKIGKWAAENAKEVTEMALENEMNKAEYSHDVQQQLQEIEGHIGNEAPKRLEVFRRRENMRQVSEKYRAVLSKGLRLMEERKAFNQRVAAKTQGKRYMDMAFRLNLNDALSKYRAMFDLAARYAYLAAKAYDYETNLSHDDPASAQPLLSDIVKKRTLGQYQSGKYVVGRGGLGDILARLSANFDALRGQMGLNNPQVETGRFSLRYEKFRIKSDAASDDDWRKELQKHRKDDLWALPEFRKFCRPFAPESEQFQPGLAIPFETNVIFGKNFFGQQLGGGDHAYDPTNFATKVRSVGLWFEGYDNSQLSETPRAYLIPAGMDVMLVPNSADLDEREWTIVDQKLPIPLPVGDSDLNNPDWIPSLDSLDGSMTQIRRYSSFRAYHDAGYFDASQMSYDSRLVGRSVWNSRWMLIIPGGTFHFDADKGLDTFIKTVTDIKLFFETYAVSGN